MLVHPALYSPGFSGCEKINSDKNKIRMRNFITNANPNAFLQFYFSHKVTAQE